MSSSSRPSQQDPSDVIGAFVKSGIPIKSNDAGLLSLPPEVDDEAPAGLIALGSALEFVFEFAKECIQLFPLYSFSQPLAVLKTRILYRTIQHVPAPRFQEVDEDGHVVGQNSLQLQPISWHKIRRDEGSSAFWGGWGARVVHQALRAALAQTTFEVLLFAPGNNTWGIIGKFLASMTLSSIIVHPFDVVQTRMAAGIAGYTKVNVYHGLMRVLKDDAAYAGLGLSTALGVLSAPVRFAWIRFPFSLPWMLMLFPLDRASTLARLRQPLKDDETDVPPEGRPPVQTGKGLWSDASFRYYLSLYTMELTISTFSSVFWSALIEAAEAAAEAKGL